MATSRRLSMFLLALLLAGCTSSPASTSTTSVEEPATPAAVGATTAPPEDETTTTQPEDLTTTSAAEAETDPFLGDLDLAVVAQSTPTAGGGARPTLAWSPLAEAAEYTVLVLDPDGSPWWSWSGAGTSVVLGGVAAAAEAGGPRAGDGVTWVVFAFGEDGTLVGVSPRRAVEE